MLAQHSKPVVLCVKAFRHCVNCDLRCSSKQIAWELALKSYVVVGIRTLDASLVETLSVKKADVTVKTEVGTNFSPCRCMAIVVFFGRIEVRLWN